MDYEALAHYVAGKHIADTAVKQFIERGRKILEDSGIDCSEMDKLDDTTT